MKICELIKKYNLSVFCNTHCDKEYLYTCVLGNALTHQRDFIYLPFSYNRKEIFSLIEKALENPYCKGFIINKSWLRGVEFNDKFNEILSRYFSRLEVVASAGNIYNLAYSIAKDNSEVYKFNVLSIVGFEDVSTVRDCLFASMTKPFRVSCSEESWDVWQKTIEPLLNVDENTDWAIVEVIPCKRFMMEYVGQYSKNHIIFTKLSLMNMNTWESLDNFSEEVAKIFSESQNVLSIYNFSANEVVDRMISYDLQNRYYIVNPMKAFKDERLNRSFALARNFLLNIGIEPYFVENDKLYNEYLKNGKTVFRLNREKVCYNSVKDSLDVFFAKYPADKAIVILEHITGMGNYKENVYSELLSKIADFIPNVLILIDTKAYMHFFKRKNRSTYVKYFNYKPNEIKVFLDGISDSNSVIYLAASRKLPFLEEVDSE